MAKRLEELEATIQYERIRFDNGDNATVILDAVTPAADGSLKDVTLKGPSEDGEPEQWLTYRFYGAWGEYKNQRTGQTERQFRYKTFVRSAPHGRTGITKYLSKAPGLGLVLSNRLYDRFKGDAVKILREHPDVAAAACKGLSPAIADQASEFLKREQGLEACSIELADLLDGHGLPKGTAKAAIKEWGNRAVEIIRTNPYRLMEFRGCGFKRADALYLELGHPPARLKRQALCAWHHAASDRNGDTWQYRKTIELGLAGAIAGADVRSGPAIELAGRAGILAVLRTRGVSGPPHWDGDTCWIAEGRKARNEARLAEYVCEALQESEVCAMSWPPVESIAGISDHQRAELSKALVGHLGILGGSPGCGKTYVVGKLVAALGATFQFGQIALAAPTGKAAVRLTETLSQHGVPLAARTIHSLLQVQQQERGDGWSLAFNRSCPLPFRVIVVDEASMIDTDLACALFAARARGALVLLVGDVNQLAPVGHGAPLRDLIAAGVPYGELREIKRNDGGIVLACAAIRDGQRFQPGGNLQVVCGASDPPRQIDAMLDAIDAAAHRLDVHPVWGVQVLVAVNKNSELARKKLNKLLQQQLNPAPEVKGSPFRLGDKIVNTKNGWFPIAPDAPPLTGDVQVNDKNQVYVANGELGEAARVEPNFLEVRLTAPARLIVVPRGQADVNGDDEDDESTGTGCNWDLGYALSVHRFQGSEIPAAIVMLDDSGGAARICTREWLYTAISRGKQECYLVGSLGVAYAACKRTAIDKRKTFLKERILEGLQTL